MADTSTTVTVTISGHEVSVVLEAWSQMMIARLRYAEHQRDRARELARMLWPHIPAHVQAEVVDRLAGDFPTWLTRP